MMISFVTNNFPLMKGMEGIIQKCDSFNCEPCFLIIDTTMPEALMYLNSNKLVTACGIFMLVNNINEIYLLQHVNFVCPVIYIELSSEINEIESKVNDFIRNAKSRNNCHYNIGNILFQRLVPRNELLAVRMFFMGEDILKISKELRVSKKSALNYIRNAMVKLNLKFSVQSYNLFRTYEFLVQRTYLKKDCGYDGVYDEIKCLLIKNRIRLTILAV